MAALGMRIDGWISQIMAVTDPITADFTPTAAAAYIVMRRDTRTQQQARRMQSFLSQRDVPVHNVLLHLSAICVVNPTSRVHSCAAAKRSAVRRKRRGRKGVISFVIITVISLIPNC